MTPEPIFCTHKNDALELIQQYAKENHLVLPNEIELSSIVKFDVIPTVPMVVTISFDSEFHYTFSKTGMATIFKNWDEKLTYVNSPYEQPDLTNPAIQLQLNNDGYILYYDFDKKQYIRVYVSHDDLSHKPMGLIYKYPYNSKDLLKFMVYA